MSTGPEKDTKNTAQPIHALTVAETYERFTTGPGGLTQAEAEGRLLRYGKNVIREVKGKPLLFKFAANFTHLMAIMLWIGGAVGFLAQLPQLGIAIWMVNIINGLFSFWQEYRAEKATEALKKLLPSYARVLRDGGEQRILSEDLVPGDLMLLAEGDRISADGRLVEAADSRSTSRPLLVNHVRSGRPVNRCCSPKSSLCRPPQHNLCRNECRYRHRESNGRCNRDGYRVWENCPPDPVGQG